MARGRLGGDRRVQHADDGATASFTPAVPVMGPPNNPFKGIGTSISAIDDASEGGFISATFDDFAGFP